MHIHLTPRELNRYWRYVRVREAEECWLWNGPLNSNGYGQLWLRDRNIYAHRIAYYLANGTWAEPCTLHSCDTPPCCNPRHLHEGTKAENNRERNARGRNTLQKLSPTDIPEIRRLAAAGIKDAAIAEHYPVSRSTISQIVHRSAWKHIP